MPHTVDHLEGLRAEKHRLHSMPLRSTGDIGSLFKTLEDLVLPNMAVTRQTPYVSLFTFEAEDEVDCLSDREDQTGAGTRMVQVPDTSDCLDTRKVRVAETYQSNTAMGSVRESIDRVGLFQPGEWKGEESSAHWEAVVRLGVGVDLSGYTDFHAYTDRDHEEVYKGEPSSQDRDIPKFMDRVAEAIQRPESDSEKPRPVGLNEGWTQNAQLA